MKNNQLNRLLNTACEIITSLEHHADDDLKKSIDAFFNEIMYADQVDDEMRRLQIDADMEAQDFSKFREDKI